MERIITSTAWHDLRDRIGEALNEASQSFVHIGYLLRIAQDTRILEGSGYENVNEFAKGEFGLEESQTSRFININKRFSEGGNSDRLKIDYQHFGWSKLSIMLTLPDNIVEEITPEYSKAEIQTIAAEVKEELTSEKSDLEVMMENPQAAEQPMYSKALYEVLHVKPDMFKAMMDAETEDDVRQLFTPLGEATYFVRLEGIGKVMISMTGSGAVFTAVRSGEKENHTWTEIYEEVFVVKTTEMTPAECWKLAYGEEAPEELAEKPAEPEKEEKKESLYKKSIEKSKKKPEKKSRVEPEKKPEKPKEKEPEPEIKEEPEIEEVAPVQTVTDFGKIPAMNPPEPTYLERLWQQVHEYGKMIAEETDVKNLRRMIEAITSTCFQIEDEEDDNT